MSSIIVENCAKICKNPYLKFINILEFIIIIGNRLYTPIRWNIYGEVPGRKIANFEEPLFIKLIQKRRFSR